MSASNEKVVCRKVNKIPSDKKKMFDRPTRLLPGGVGSFWRAFVWWISCAGCAHCVVVHVKTVKTKLSGGTDSNKSNLINYRQAISRNYTRQLYKHIHVVRHICSTCLLLLLVSKILKGLDYNNTTLVDCLLSRDDFDFSVADTLGNDKSKAVIRRATIPQTWREHLPENGSWILIG